MSLTRDNKGPMMFANKVTLVCGNIHTYYILCMPWYKMTMSQPYEL